MNDSRLVTAHLVAEAERHGWARVYPVGAVTHGMRGERLADLGEMVDAGAVALSDDGLPVADAGLMRRALLYARHLGVPVTQHAEDLDLTGDGVMHEGEWSTRLGLPGIPGAAEDVVVARDLILAEDTGGRYHVAHLSTARSLELVRRARAAGGRVTCEVTPHHLLLTDRAVAEPAFSTDCQDEAAAALGGRPRGAARRPGGRHGGRHRLRPRAARPGREGRPVLPARRSASSASRPPCRCASTAWSAAASSACRASSSCCRPARRAATACPAAASPPAARPTSPCSTSTREVVVDPQRFHSRSRNTPFAGWTLRGTAVGTFVGGRRVRP